MTPEAVSQALAALIEDRAARGNCQDKHGIDAAEGYELFWVMDKLDKILGKPHE